MNSYKEITHCYYINLDKRPDRKYSIEGELKKSNLLQNIYERVAAVDGTRVHPRSEESEGLLTENAICDILAEKVTAWGLSMTPGGLGVLLSYKKVFEKISKLDTLAITFEDDILLSESFDEKLNVIVSELPEDFDLCYLGYCDVDAEGEKYSDNLSIPRGRVLCLPSLIVSPRGARHILEIFKNLDNQIDTALNVNFRKLNVFISNEKIVSVKNHMGTDIQGPRSLVKNYDTQNYIFATLAYGDIANDKAVKLAKDLEYFKQKIVIITNKPEFYIDMENVIAIRYPKNNFSYNDKIYCFEEGFKHAECVVCIDADCRIYYEDYKKAYGNLKRIIKPGFHPSWDWGVLSRPDSGFFTSTDISIRIKGYGEKALDIVKEYNIDITKAKHYQEGFIIVCKEDGKETEFLNMWRRFSDVLDKYEIENKVSRVGIGEGNLIGLCVEYSKLTVNSQETANQIGKEILYNFYGASRTDYMKRLKNRKMIRKSDGVSIKTGKCTIPFQKSEVFLTYDILNVGDNLLCLSFEWDLNGAVEFLDHEFTIDETIFHFNSEKTNEFYFEKKRKLKIYHTYDWYGNKDLKLIEDFDYE